MSAVAPAGGCRVTVMSISMVVNATARRGQGCEYLSAGPSTHHVFPSAGESVNGTLSMVRQKDSERLYNIVVKFRVRRGETLSSMTTVVYEMP